MNNENISEEIDPNLEAEANSDQAFLDGLKSTVEGIEKLREGEVVEAEEAPEIVEEEPEEEVEEGGAPDSEEEKSVKKPDKMWKVKRSKYKALAEKRAALEGERIALEENAKLKGMLEESLNSGTYHYGKTTYAELEKAKEFKKRAIEEGDVDGLIEADLKINAAQNNVLDLEKWATEPQPAPVNNNDSYQEANNGYYQETTPEMEQEIAENWLDSHNYLKPNSKNYNLKLAEEVSQFINHLDSELINSNQSDVLFSEQYFEVIDNYIGEVRKKPKGNSESSAHVGGVRNSYSSSSSNRAPPIRVTFSADEAIICKNMGVTKEEYLRCKSDRLKKGK